MKFLAFWSKKYGIFGTSDVNAEGYRLSFYYKAYRVTVSPARIARWKASFDRNCSLANNYGCGPDYYPGCEDENNGLDLGYGDVCPN